MNITGIIRLSHYHLICIDRAIAYIDKYYKNALSAEDISAEVDLNIKKLRAGIRKKTGYSVHEYHSMVRVEKSKPLLLETSYPLKVIANMVGFKNESHFCRKFKEFVSMTPNEFRYLTEIRPEDNEELPLKMKAV